METLDSNKTNMLAWYKALKSGDYTQVTSELARRTPEGRMGFCCLGVACEVAIANGIELTREGDETLRYDMEDMVLPDKVTDWLGVGRNNPYVGEVPNEYDMKNCGCSDCAGMISASKANDSLHWTFDQIADGIYEMYGLAEVDPEAARG